MDFLHSICVLFIINMVIFLGYILTVVLSILKHKSNKNWLFDSTFKKKVIIF